MSTAQQRLSKLFDPHHPLYLRKLTNVSQMSSAMKDITEVVVVDGSSLRPVFMILGLYEAHKDLYHQHAAERETPPVSAETIAYQIDVLRTVTKSASDNASYNDYLIIMWSATGNLSYMTELLGRRLSKIEEVSVTATWAVETISSGSETFRNAVAVAALSN